MLSNSWLYHYYSVQSKIQMGLTYEGARLPQINNSSTVAAAAAAAYYPYQPPQAPINPQHYQIHQPYHHYDYSPPVSNDINHNSSPSMKDSLTVNAPVDYTTSTNQPHSMEKLSPTHQQQQQQHHLSHQHHENGSIRNSSNTPPEPSRKKPAADDKSNKLHDKKLSKVDYKSVRISNKKYTFKRIESLHISDNNTTSNHHHHHHQVESEEVVQPRAAAVTTYDGHSEHTTINVMEAEHRDGQMLYLNSSIHSRSRISKNFSASLPVLPHVIGGSSEPASSEIDWNPSPTWSDNNIQKVPDIMHQQLSPYLITTPPTPISASYVSAHGSTFTFDWAPEHYVPTVAGLHDERALMELAPAPRCYYNNRPQLMSIDDTNNHHKDEAALQKVYK